MITKFLTLLVLPMIAIGARADELSTLGRLSAIVDSQCLRFYGVDSNAPVEALEQKPMSAVDKLACAYPIAYNKVTARLKTLEQLDPASAWGKRTSLTLAARIYKFDYLVNTPRAGDQTEIPAVHADLMILHRILAQTTPYALAFAFPKLTGADADLPMATRIAAVGVEELTPWSATLRQANGTDCYGPAKAECLANRAQAFQDLLQAIELLAQDQKTSGYITDYSQSKEAGRLQAHRPIELSVNIKNAVAGAPVDYILGKKTTTAWWNVRPDLRDTLDYLAADDRDLRTYLHTMTSVLKLDCHTIFGSLITLAADGTINPLAQAIKPYNPMQTALDADPNIKNDGLSRQALINQQSCARLPELSLELNLRGLLSRFQAYQIHALLLSSSKNDTAPADLLEPSKRYALSLDIERVIKEVKAKARATGMTLKPNSSPVPKQLVDYVFNLIKEHQL